MGERFIDTGQLAEMTGDRVRTGFRLPDEPDELPMADAVVVAPATFNTVNKWAAGITDTFATGLLCELMGVGVSILAVPLVKDALALHVAFGRSLDQLRGMGVHVLFDPDALPQERMPSWQKVLDVHRVMGVSAAGRDLVDASARGRRIARARRRRGLSQAALAGLVGRSESWLSQVERGLRQVDSYNVFTSLAEILRRRGERRASGIGTDDQRHPRHYRTGRAAKIRRHTVRCASRAIGIRPRPRPRRGVGSEHGSPAAKHAEPDEEGGRGLMLVDALCEQWSWDVVPGWAGKVVWAVSRPKPMAQ
jgi:transcriptional regulator with XRE-family HTH domain